MTLRETIEDMQRRIEKLEMTTIKFGTPETTFHANGGVMPLRTEDDFKPVDFAKMACAIQLLKDIELECCYNNQQCKSCLNHPSVVGHTDDCKLWALIK